MPAQRAAASRVIQERVNILQGRQAQSRAPRMGGARGLLAFAGESCSGDMVDNNIVTPSGWGPI